MSQGTDKGDSIMEENQYESQFRNPYQEEKKGKKKKVAEKLGIMLAMGLVFGLTSGVVFTGTSFVGNRILNSDFLKGYLNTAEQTQQADETGDSATLQSTTEGLNKKVAEATPTVAQKESYSVAEIAENCMPSVVSISIKGVEEVQSWFGTMQQEVAGAGSGIVVAQNDTELLIATNNHVVENAEELSVCFNDTEDQVYSAYIKGKDSTNDLAIIAIKLEDIPTAVLESIRIAALGDSDSLVVGEQVVAIGNALGYGQSVTSGYVSAVDREVKVGNNSTHLIQTDAAINPGNSGGALFNMQGEVIGINSAKLAANEVEGIGYAIPISNAMPILNDLENREVRNKVEEENRGALGITCMTVSTEASNAYGIPEGVYVTGVNENSAAEQAGLQEGDVIVKFDGLETASSDALVENLEYYSVGETVELTIMRMAEGGYSEKTVAITLQAKEQKEKQERTAFGEQSQLPGEIFRFNSGRTMF